MMKVRFNLDKTIYFNMHFLYYYNTITMSKRHTECLILITIYYKVFSRIYIYTSWSNKLLGLYQSFLCAAEYENDEVYKILR